MIYKDKDITTIEAPALIAHGVNCSDAMGSGVARALYMKWPSVKGEYHKVFKSKHPMFHVSLGDVQFVDAADGITVANCFTQRKYGSSGERFATVEAIELALFKVADHANYVLKCPDIYIPRIGAGLGGLDWKTEVLPVLSNIEGITGVQFTVCEI